MRMCKQCKIVKQGKLRNSQPLSYAFYLWYAIFPIQVYTVAQSDLFLASYMYYTETET